MAQTGYSPISLYYSTTASAVPTAGNLVNGELGLNITDGKLYYKDNTGTVKLLASNVTPIANGGTGLTSFTAGQIHYGSFLTSANLFWDATNNRLGVNTNTPAVTVSFVGTDAIRIPAGTTAQQPTGVAGYLRFNTTTTQFEGYNGTTWSSVGGATISNDTATSTNIYPISASATSGTALTVYTSNAKFLYKPSTGELQASEMVASNGLFVNATTIAASYTIASGYNAHSVGPVAIASGQSVTVTSGQRWLVF